MGPGRCNQDPSLTHGVCFYIYILLGHPCLSDFFFIRHFFLMIITFTFIYTFTTGICECLLSTKMPYHFAHDKWMWLPLIWGITSAKRQCIVMFGMSNTRHSQSFPLIFRHLSLNDIFLSAPTLLSLFAVFLQLQQAFYLTHQRVWWTKIIYPPLQIFTSVWQGVGANLSSCTEW